MEKVYYCILCSDNLKFPKKDDLDKHLVHHDTARDKATRDNAPKEIKEARRARKSMLEHERRVRRRTREQQKAGPSKEPEQDHTGHT